MISNYFIYLNNLPKEEKIEQILILLAFFTILFIICCVIEFLKLKFINKNKNNFFQKILKNL